jgi:hypothetical protein
MGKLLIGLPFLHQDLVQKSTCLLDLCIWVFQVQEYMLLPLIRTYSVHFKIDGKFPKIIAFYRNFDKIMVTL